MKEIARNQFQDKKNCLSACKICLFGVSLGKPFSNNRRDFLTNRHYTKLGASSSIAYSCGFFYKEKAMLELHEGAAFQQLFRVHELLQQLQAYSNCI